MPLARAEGLNLYYDSPRPKDSPKDSPKDGYAFSAQLERYAASLGHTVGIA